MRPALISLVILAALVAMTVPAMAQYGSCNWWVVYGYSFPAQLVRGPYCSWSDCERDAAFLRNHYLDFNYRCQQVF